MTRLSILFLLTFSFIFYCEQREVYYSELANKEASSPLVVIYERASTVISCGAKCLNDKCCVRFIYNTISKQCMGVHSVEKDVYFYQQVPSLSSEMQQFRKGCGSDWVEFKGHCYFYGQQTVTWSNAKLECQNMCSYLVEIEDKEEADWLSTAFSKNSSCTSNLYASDCTVWTGLNDLAIEGQYVLGPFEHVRGLYQLANRPTKLK